MLGSILKSLFRCSHPRTTFPMTPARRTGVSRTYVTCLDCGQEFNYDWKSMQIVEPRLKAPPRAPTQPDFSNNIKSARA